MLQHKFLNTENLVWEGGECDPYYLKEQVIVVHNDSKESLVVILTNIFGV